MAAKNRFNPIDCLGAALPDEEYFVLLARDPAMPAMLGIWASLRVGNLQAATDNFMLLMEPGLVRHYMEHPDGAKSEEAIETANRAAEWRAANVGGPNGVPTWKKSLVRPQMLEIVDIPPKASNVLSGNDYCADCRAFGDECECKGDQQ